MNRRDANLQLARRYPGGIEALAQRLGKRPDTLRKELTGVQGYKFDIDEEEMLVALCQAAGVRDALAPITAAAVNAGALIIELPSAATGETPSLQCLAQAAREFGEFAAALAQAESDGRISANEKKDIEREGAQLVAAIQACIAGIARQYEATRPAHVRSVGAA
jgi:hypothetical protein